MKRCIVVSMMIVLVTLMSSLVPAYASQADSVIRIQIDGETLHIPSNEQQPVIVDGRTLVPLRAVMEALGFTVYWDGGQRAAYLFMDTRPSIMVPLQSVPEQKGYAISIGARHHFHGNLYTSNTRDANGVVITLDVPPQIINGRTMIPLRAISEVAGMDVAWNSTTRTAIINTGTIDNNVVTPSVTPPPVTIPPATTSPAAIPSARVLALGNNGNVFVYTDAEPLRTGINRLEPVGAGSTGWTRVHTFEVGTTITVNTTREPIMEGLEGPGVIILGGWNVAGDITDPAMLRWEQLEGDVIAESGFYVQSGVEWEGKILLDEYTIQYTFHTVGRIYQVWAAGGFTWNIQVVEAGTTPPVSNQPSTNDTTGNSLSDDDWCSIIVASHSVYMLPNRMQTAAERQAWIDEYIANGGPSTFELEIVRHVNLARVKYGLHELEVCINLSMAARFHAQTLAQSDVAADGRPPSGLVHSYGPYARSGDVAISFGGTLGRWTGGNSQWAWFCAERIVNRWLESPGHRRYLLRDDAPTTIGAGSQIGASGRPYHYLFIGN